MPTPAVSDHLEPDGADYPDGVYRVVGTDEGGATLLRVADAAGRRVHTGDLVTVDAADLDGFAPADDPDGNRPVGAELEGGLRNVYWSLRAFVQQLLANPVPTAVAVAVLVAGQFGDRVVSVPDTASAALVVVGALTLAYVGSGRLS
ncbi:hypothetical protein [Halorarius halobius]|uniref:hypothetical protein n=1 Tax=Halorarius halobius TaxID=2962671 RepID=UPI0020CEBF63|nr:hypothetical protein [Halorarius halobius]